MTLDAMMRGLALDPADDAVIDRAGVHSYAGLTEHVELWKRRLTSAGVPAAATVSLEGNFSLDAVAAFIAMMTHGVVIVPLSKDAERHHDEFLETAQVEWRVAPEHGELSRTSRRRGHAHYDELERRASAGLVLFTSGSTGPSKAAVHDLSCLLEKFTVPKRRFRTLVFLQPDHIGGINTLLYTVCNAGTLIAPEHRQPGYICDLIDRHRVELLPTSPTFLKLLLLARDPSRHHLSSLQLVTYGTEPMPESTLRDVREALGHVRLQQTYGLTEVGILRSQSRDDGSLWVRVGGEGYDVQVRDNRLWIKARSAMLGYLNAPSPFSADGYMDTGDTVEVEGEWLRILGRQSDIINVGGSKVYPVEVEDVILQMPEVDDVVVRSEQHPLVGQIVVAHVKLRRLESVPEFKVRLREFCGAHLPAFRIPARVVITDAPLYGARFKKQRRSVAV